MQPCCMCQNDRAVLPKELCGSSHGNIHSHSEPCCPPGARATDEEDYAELTAFLTEIKLLRVRDTLVENEVTFDALLEFDERDLTELGLNKGPRVKIMATMRTYRSGSAPSASTRAPPRVRAQKSDKPECEICFDPYTSTAAKTPRVLSCGHTFCHECLAKCLAPLQKARGGGHKVLSCPQCRETTKVPRGSAEELMKNYALA